MNQQEVNFEILSQQGIVQISETPMFTEYLLFGQTFSDSNCSISFEEKDFELIQ